jgi:[FeFe] hydrogenase H-cluster maturation GTPase HydF
MRQTPKSLRLHIGIMGKTNVGKSTLLNMITGQDVSITSEIPGTTTDVVEKTMELLPIGPVVFMDTAGMDDTSALGGQRIRKAREVLHRSDVVLLVTEFGQWGPFEEDIVKQADGHQIPVIVIVNKIDRVESGSDCMDRINVSGRSCLMCSALRVEEREQFLRELKSMLIKVCPEDFLRLPTLMGDLVPAGGMAVMVVPIDLQAPKGRLILPQVQAIRDCLDNDAAVLVVKERELAAVISNMRRPPDVVVCDSQVILKVTADTPPQVKCTTFSTLFARFKGDLIEMAKGAAFVDQLRPGDKVLIAEACSHHAMEDDIARVKIPRWLRQYVGADVVIDTFSGRDYPDTIEKYRLIIHCGGCVINRREMLYRIELARNAGVPITNYGVCISFLQGVLERVLEPFPAALDAFENQRRVIKQQSKIIAQSPPLTRNGKGH